MSTVGNFLTIIIRTAKVIGIVKAAKFPDNSTDTFTEMRHETIEKGDGKIMGIAAASILAKDARDTYVSDVCDEYPLLDERYNLKKNVGYATKAHLDGIKQHGISEFHRKTFGICKSSSINKVSHDD